MKFKHISSFFDYLVENKEQDDLIGKKFEIGSGIAVKLNANLIDSLEQWMEEHDIPFHTMNLKRREKTIETILANLTLDDKEIEAIKNGTEIEISDDNFYSDALRDIIDDLS